MFDSIEICWTRKCPNIAQAKTARSHFEWLPLSSPPPPDRIKDIANYHEHATALQPHPKISEWLFLVRHLTEPKKSQSHKHAAALQPSPSLFQNVHRSNKHPSVIAQTSRRYSWACYSNKAALHLPTKQASA
jgi:hypothetical protein